MAKVKLFSLILNRYTDISDTIPSKQQEGQI